MKPCISWLAFAVVQDHMAQDINEADCTDSKFDTVDAASHALLAEHEPLYIFASFRRFSFSMHVNL